MKPIKTFITFFLILFSLHSISQEKIYFQENFESGTLPAGWNNQFAQGSNLWEYRNGGHKYESDENTRHPFPAYEGNYNALFQKEGIVSKTRLVTKPINLDGAIKPILTFYHAQDTNRFFGNLVNDELLVLYKKTQTDVKWDTLAYYYTLAADWVKRSVVLPQTNFYNNSLIAFEGRAYSGFGTCIDAIKIYESDTAKAVVNSVSFNKGTASIIGGTSLNPVLRMDVVVKGNIGTITLDSICLQSLNTSDTDIVNNKIFLFATETEKFENPVSIPVNTSFVSGKAIFSNIGYNKLSQGTNYIWVTFDLAKNIPPDHVISFTVPANGIKISDKLYPSTAYNLPGAIKIRSGIFTDDFETDNGWTLSGLFQKGIPQGKGGEFGNQDPAKAYSGAQVLGVNLAGDYNNSQGYEADKAISKTINCKYYKNTQLDFYRFLNIEGGDKAAVKVSSDNGNTWEIIWINTSQVYENMWGSVSYNLKDYIDRRTNVKLKITTQSTDGSWRASGWNIDNLSLSGEYIANDVGVCKWESPKSGCEFAAVDSVKVWVKNYGPKATDKSFPLFYSFDNGLTKTFDTCYAIIEPDDSVLFTFKTPINLTNGGIFENVISQTTFSLDDDNRNDGCTASLLIKPILNAPVQDNFDQEFTFWSSYGNNNSWTRDIPYKELINSTHTSPYCWVTNNYSYYNSNESSYAESYCFNLSNLMVPILSIHYFSKLEKGKDGANIEYSINDGKNWSLLPSHSYLWKGNWYTSSLVEALNNPGWDTSTTSWTLAKQALPDVLKGQTSVKFRVHFASDSTNEYEGFAFDDFKIFEAPVDAAILSIDTISSSCYGTNTKSIWFTLKNVGIRPILPKDTLAIKYIINNTITYNQQFVLEDTLEIAQSISLKFQKDADTINLPGDYNIKVIINEKEPGFYGTNNDTAQKNISIYPLPFTSLKDTFSSAKLDTLTIKPHLEASYTYTWADSSHLSTWNTTTEGSYWLNVKFDAAHHFCQFQDTFYVKKLIRNYAINRIISPKSDCEIIPEGKVSFSIINKGTDTLEIKDIPSFTSYYKHNSEPEKSITVNNTRRMKPGDTLLVSFNDTIKNLAPDDTLSAFISAIDLDVNLSNDTMKSIIKELGYPVISLGNDTSVVALYFELDPGSGFKKYLWIDSTQNQTLKAYDNGLYWVEVTDNNNCSSRDSINLSISSNDISIVALSSPKNDCALSSESTVKVKIVNTGTLTLSSGSTLNLGYKLQNWVNESLMLSADLAHDDSLDFEFSSKTDLSSVGNYTLKCFVSSTDDMNQENDTISQVIKNYGFPSLELGNDSDVYNKSFVLDAQKGTGRSFLWQDNTTQSDTFKIVNSGKYFVTVTDSVSGCQSSDTVRVNLIIYDGTIADITSPTALKECLNTFNEIAFNYSNIGNAIIPQGTKLYFGYFVNNKTFIDSLILQNNLGVSSSVSLKFTNILNFIKVGQNDFKLFASFVMDKYHENDTFSYSIPVYKNPDRILGGPDKITASYDPVTIKPDKGTGYTYQWNDAQTSSEIIVYTTGEDTSLYTVTITEPNGCFSNDSIKVFIIQPDVKPIKLLNPINHCMDKVSNAQLVCQNAGNYLFQTGDTISTLVQNDFDNMTSTATITSILSKNILPGDTFTVTVNILQNILYIGQNNLLFASTIAHDVNVTDALSVTHYTADPPQFTLCNGFDTLVNYSPIYTIDPGLGSTYNYLWNDGTTAETRSISSSGNYKVKISEKLYGCSSTDSVYIDIALFDISVDTITLPEKHCLKEMNSFSASLSFHGNKTLTAGQSISISYSINNSYFRNIDTTLESDYNNEEEFFLSFLNQKSHFIAGENYINFRVKYDNDYNAANDSFQLKFMVYEKPVLTLSQLNDTVVLESNYMLTAGNNMNCTYSWNNGQTGRIIEADAPGKYIVTAEDNGSKCINLDSVIVLMKVYDSELTYINVNSKCPNELDSLTIGIKNTGKNQFPENSIINVEYKVDGLPFEASALILDQPLSKGQETRKTIAGLKKLNLSGNVTLTVVAFIVPDNSTLNLNTVNDSMQLKFTVYQKPVLSLSQLNDTIELADNYLLTAGENLNYSYSWNTGQIGRIIEANLPGKYIVTAVDNVSKCASLDSAVVLMKVYDSELSYLNVNSNCSNNLDSLTVGIRNTGKNEFPINSNIILKYQLEGLPFADTTLKLDQPLAKGHEVRKTISGLKKLNIIGEGEMKVIAYIEPDTFRNNDTSVYTFTVIKSPEISIDNKNELYLNYPYVVNVTGLDKYDYTWSNGNKTKQINAEEEGIYWVKATDLVSGCYSTDTVHVFHSDFDGQITVVGTNQPMCAGDINPLKISYMNNGNRPLIENDTILIVVKVNKVVVDNFIYKLTTPLNAKEEIVITYILEKNKAVVGDNVIVVSSKSIKDIDPSNDSLKTTVNFKASPVVNLENGKEEITFTQSYTLDAGTGFASYLWNTKETTQKITVANSGVYKVTVRNTAGCSASDTITMDKKTDINITDGIRSFYLYPVPTSTELTINLENNPMQKTRIEIYSADLKKVYSEDVNGISDFYTKTIDVSNWEKGSYYIRIFETEGSKILNNKFTVN